MSEQKGYVFNELEKEYFALDERLNRMQEEDNPDTELRAALYDRLVEVKNQLGIDD